MFNSMVLGNAVVSLIRGREPEILRVCGTEKRKACSQNLQEETWAFVLLLQHLFVFLSLPQSTFLSHYFSTLLLLDFALLFCLSPNSCSPPTAFLTPASPLVHSHFCRLSTAPLLHLVGTAKCDSSWGAREHLETQSTAVTGLEGETKAEGWPNC
jgi:hypothetical protein